MRHDAHYVETLAASAGAPVGRMVPIDQVDPNPDQPRQAMGDLAELISSVTEKGIIEPLIVRQNGARYQIIAGERRYHAAVQAGLTELPVVIRDVDDGEMLELALIENIQRKDLTPFEESEAMDGLAQQLRLHARGPGQAAGQVAHVDHRSLVAERHSAGRPQGLPAGGHLQPSRCCCRSSARAIRRRCWRWSRRSPARAAPRANSSARKPRRPKPAGPRRLSSRSGRPARPSTCASVSTRSNGFKDEVISALEAILEDLKHS